eukprot:8407435-Heterocapsa_arctica.AAC.1
MEALTNGETETINNMQGQPRPSPCSGASLLPPGGASPGRNTHPSTPGAARPGSPPWPPGR